jgi:hypothetical protein
LVYSLPSTPNHFYWIWHVRLLLLSCILFAFLAALVGATGLYSVAALYGKAHEPVTCFDQVRRDSGVMWVEKK